MIYSDFFVANRAFLVLTALIAIGGREGRNESSRLSNAENPELAPSRSNIANSSAKTPAPGQPEDSIAGSRTTKETTLEEGVPVADDPLAGPEMKQHAQNAAELGWRYLQKGDPETALRRFGMAIRHDDQYAPGYYGIAYAYSVQGELKDAVEYYHKTLALDESHLYANANLGFALLQLGREEEAMQALNAALKIDPDCGEAHLSYANYYAAHERWAEAGESARRALELEQVVHAELKQLLEDHGVVFEPQ